MSTKKCPNCGNVVSNEAKFCHVCGQNIQDVYQKDSEKEKKYEIDFLLVKKKKVCPVEVKSSGYSSHKSFDYFIKKYPIKIEDRYIIYTKDLKFEDGITYIPVYMAGLL